MYSSPRSPKLENRDGLLRATPRTLALVTAACVGLFAAPACSNDPESPGGQAGTAGTSARGGSSSGIGGSSGASAGNSSAAGGGAGASGAGGAPRGGAGGVAAGGASGGGGTGNVAGGTGGLAAGGSAGIDAQGGSGGDAGGVGGTSAGMAGAAGTSGSAGSAGSAGNGGNGGGSCPAGPFGEPATAGSVTKVMGVPPAGFGTGSSSNVEGPVWLDGSLYVSHIQEGVTAPPPARILKITGDTVEEFLRDSGSNGLALAADGRLVVARHTTGSLSLLDLATKMFTPLAEQFMNARFDSPNDIAVRSDGNVYFSDPDYQAPNPRPQTATRVYRVDPAGNVTVVDASLNQPNGVTLSPDQNTLYVASPAGIRQYPVSADGSVGTSASFSNTSSDGMVVDCAGNLYLTNNRDVVILDSMGDEVTRLMDAVPNGSSTTNVAFGGTDRTRLYITARANAGLWYVDMNVPGFPY